MLILRNGDSLFIAKELIEKTGLQDSLILLESVKRSESVPPGDLLKLLLALSACNLVQTMKEEFIDQAILPDDQLDITDDYVAETLRRQNVLKMSDGAELMEICVQILYLVGELEIFWRNDEDPKGPGPRYYCVKEVLRRLGNEENFPLRDTLFEFMYLQHKHFIDYFTHRLKPAGPPKNLAPEAG
jgi:hypothetical protein